jgi:hypothetical protein
MGWILEMENKLKEQRKEVLIGLRKHFPYVWEKHAAGNTTFCCPLNESIIDGVIRFSIEDEKLLCSCTINVINEVWEYITEQL